jgi:hypothetical protein
MRRDTHGRRSSCALVALTVAFLVTIGVPPGAEAYTITTDGAGTPIHWDLNAIGAIPWRLSNHLVADVDDPSLIVGAIYDAFATWANQRDSAIDFAFEGLMNQGEPEVDAVNLVTLGSRLQLPTGVIAITFISSFGSRLYDADIVFNAAHPFSTRGDPARFDVQAIATHEVGHLLGLENTGLMRATMAPFAIPGDLGMRTLESDDRIAASVVYPVPEQHTNFGILSGFVRESDEPVFLGQVVAVNGAGQAVASGLTRADGSYRIQGLPPGSYYVYAEPFDGPFVPGDFPTQTTGPGVVEPSTHFITAFH